MTIDTDTLPETDAVTRDAQDPAPSTRVDLARAVEAILIIADEPQSLVSLATALRRPVKAVHEAVNTSSLTMTVSTGRSSAASNSARSAVAGASSSAPPMTMSLPTS